MALLVNRTAEYLWGGIDLSDTENGGAQCLYTVSAQRRILETIFGLSVGYLCYTFGYRASSPGSAVSNNNEAAHVFNPGRVLLLTALSVTFGLQLAFKIISGSALFLLFPCHTLTMAWIYILASPPTTNNRYLYRFVLHFLHGPLCAVAFPVDFVLTQPFERETYWLQHGLIIFVPFYMVAKERAAYPPCDENTSFSAWVLMSFGLWSAWHWVVLQGASILTMVNIGHMLCAAKTDPFDPINYRLIGIGHQALMTGFSGAVMMAFRGMVVGDDEEGKGKSHGKVNGKVSVD